jgi:endonuclease YncB( thermonuclease family)
MKGLASWVTKFTVLCGLFFACYLYADTQLEDLSGMVTQVVDGDTVHFRPNQVRQNSTEKDLKIRMMGTDTPETHLIVGGKTYSQGFWGDKATIQLEKFVGENNEMVLKSYGLDKYGRVLGKLFREDHDINLLMVRSGWAITYIICEGRLCNKDFFKDQNVDEYVKACALAREEGRGIFNPQKPLHEMPFEFRLRIGQRKPDKYVGDLATHKLYLPRDYNKVDVCRRVFFMKVDEAHAVGFHE